MTCPVSYIMKKMKEYDAYLFDLYGTLVDIHTDEDQPAFWKKLCNVFFHYGIRYEWRGLKERYFEEVRIREAQEQIPGHEIEIDLKDVFRKLCGDLYDEDVTEVMTQFRILSTSHLRLYAGVKELLSFLKENGKKVILVSNAQEVFTMKELEDLGIVGLFDEIVISSAVGFRKPDPKIYETALQRSGLPAGKCLMIGNDPICDVKGAVNAGIDAYYIRSALSPKTENTEKTVGLQEGMDLGLLKRRIERSMKNQ